MKHKTIAIICAVIFACTGAVSTYATTSDSQVATESSPREGRTVKDAGNRPTRTPRTEKKSERKSPRDNNSNSSSSSKSRFNSNQNNNWKSR